jgi:hypothetical protein
VGKDAIWVIDPNTNALIASAWLAQVRATPANHTYRSEDNDWTMPVLVVRVPGLQPLVIMVPQIRKDSFSFWDLVSGNWRPRGRFSWQGKPGMWPESPGYIVGEAEWLTLVDKFGLAPQLEDKAGP